jgi:hypothetical protein
MGARPIGEAPMTGAQREARRKARERARMARMEEALGRIQRVQSLEKAKEIAREALGAADA